MQHLVFVRESDGQFTAQALGIPEIKATAATQDEAIQAVRESLMAWLSSGQIVPVDVPNGNPLLQWFGHAKDDPDFDLYCEEIRRYRQEVDERECSDSSSTPTT